MPCLVRTVPGPSTPAFRRAVSREDLGRPCRTMDLRLDVPVAWANELIGDHMHPKKVVMSHSI
jgi:hypothetical protein